MTVVGVLGEAVIDVLPDGEVLRPHVGGSPLNVAVGLARLGLTTRMLSPTSTDRWGTAVRTHLTAEGVRPDGAVVDAPTALAIVDVDEHGHATYRFLWDDTADLALDAGELTRALAELDVLHLGSVAAVRDPAGRVVESLVPTLPHDLVVSYDPNVRHEVMGPPEVVARRVGVLASAARIVKASAEDLAVLQPGVDPVAAARSLLASDRTSLVALTLGGDGALLLTPTCEVTVAPVTTDPVVDTVGAGDTWMAALLAALADHDVLSPAGLAALGTDELHEVGGFAARAAGIVVGRAGADPPTRAELS